MRDIEKIAEKWALYNAIKYGGRASLQAVIGKVIADLPEIRKNIREYIPVIRKIVEKVNSLSLEEQKRRLQEIAPELLEERKKEEIREDLPPLPGAEEGKVVTRYAPCPSGYLHIGHARPILVSYLYARKYKGKFILRFEDTDPRTKRPVPEAYDAILEDVEWLTGEKPDEVYVQSERMEIYYEMCKKFILKGAAYVCRCNSNDWKVKYRDKGVPCPCRDKPPEYHLEEFEKMLEGAYSEGEAVVRIKTDMSYPNPSVRDWVAFRIIDTCKYPHPRVGDKYIVWPTYNFACPVDDHLMGITHIFRMKEHAVNWEKQKFIYDHMGWKYPFVQEFGAILIEDMPHHKSEIRQLIEKGVISGWDDPALPTLRALRRRGIQPEAIRKLIVKVHIKPVSFVLDWNELYAYNREIIDPIARRLFFVDNPVELDVVNSPEFTAKIRWHPDKKEYGYRELPVDGKFYITKRDADSLKKGAEVRLMELYNIKVIDIKDGKIIAEFTCKEYEYAKDKGLRIIHWVPRRFCKKITVIMPRLKDREVVGYVEGNVDVIEEGEIVQFERFGFAKKETEDVFIYTHK